MKAGEIKRITKQVILAGIYIFLLSPLLQDAFEIKKWKGPLRGSFTQARDTTFSWKDWFSGGYQGQKEKFLRDSFGLHDYYVRLNGEANFRLFKKANAVYVVVGKENYLYETGYFSAYYGEDFVGKERIDSIIDKISRLQDTLRKVNKLLLPVLAPGKASYYPEYIPDEYLRQPQLSNYIYFSTRAGQRKIDLIDFNKYFIAQKHKSKYPLYPQYGIHWSNYGAIRAFDSIVRYAEKKLSVNLPDINFIEPLVSSELQNTDEDIIKGMNVLFMPASFPMATARWTINRDSVKDKLKLLVIADSFWWYIYSTGIVGSVFSEDRFWFYNEAAYPESFTAPMFVKKMDYKKLIREADVILILYSESTLARFSNGFVQMSYDLYFPESKNSN